jgi:hypothetical protein
MTSTEKDILLAKIDTLSSSFADVQLQSIVRLLREVVCDIVTIDRSDMGFTANKKNNND